MPGLKIRTPVRSAGATGRRNAARRLGIAYLAEVDRQPIQPGTVIPIGVLGERRMKRFPEVPTMAELGHHNDEMRAWLDAASSDVLTLVNTH